MTTSKIASTQRWKKGRLSVYSESRFPLLVLECETFARKTMSLPEFDTNGDLPVGVHCASLTEVLTRFGHGTPQRKLVSAQLARVYELANGTGKLDRFIIFGSYITTEPNPNDVDIILIMRDDFRQEGCSAKAKPLFDHLLAQQEFGASVFAIRPSHILLESVDSFIANWQIKRDKGRRGIVEVIPGELT